MHLNGKVDHPCFDQAGGGNHFSHSLLITAFSLYFDNRLDLVLASSKLGEIVFAFIVESCAMFTVSKRFLCILYPAVLICLLDKCCSYSCEGCTCSCFTPKEAS